MVAIRPAVSANPVRLRPPAPAFMAPEVRDGEPGDPASDIYAVGALLYFAVTGQEPAPDPAAVRRPTEFRPACPQVIERIVLRALQAQPDLRYFTAAEMLEDFATDAGTYDTASATLAAPHHAQVRGASGERNSGSGSTHTVAPSSALISCSQRSCPQKPP